MLTVNGGRFNKKEASSACNTEEACSTLFSNQTTFCVFVQFSIKEVGSIPRKEINRQQG